MDNAHHPFHRFGGVILIGIEVELDQPAVAVELFDPEFRILAVTSAENFVDPTHPLAQLTCGLAILIIAVEEGLAGGGQVGLQAIDGASIILLAIRGPAVELAEDVQGKGIDIL